MVLLPVAWAAAQARAQAQARARLPVYQTDGPANLRPT